MDFKKNHFSNCPLRGAMSASGRICSLSYIHRSGRGESNFSFVEFSTANIRNRNTRRAYGQAVGQFFTWCEAKSLELHQLNPVIIAAYIAQHSAAAPTVKHHLAALRLVCARSNSADESGKLGTRPQSTKQIDSLADNNYISSKFSNLQNPNSQPKPPLALN